ncbi:restriction endonuclease subunit S [Helicobacter winghamensis]|uniref:restriction endonuclease subunit S n=1 Tax=Helicobacter winghamensis TaxID=157268 RepID=UPI0018A68CB5|nr:restriction endonuclease subunit S [Helicobacter winghamensis]QOQ97598.1 restriction endonuclease subunit S [Helicobacter winghamensis]
MESLSLQPFLQSLHKEQWQEVRLGEVAEINPKETLRKHYLYKKVAMDNLEPYTKKVYSFGIESFNGGAKFRNGDTLLARITPCLENGKTAFVDFLQDDEIAFGSTEFIVLREKATISDKDFLYYLARSKHFREVAIKSMTGSSGRERVQIEVLRDFTFLLPPLTIQQKIAEILSSFDDKIDLLHRQNKTLESLALTLFRHYFIDNPRNPKSVVGVGESLRGGGSDFAIQAPPFSHQKSGKWKMGKLGDYVRIELGGTPNTAKSEYWGGDIAWINSGEINKFRIVKPTKTITKLGFEKSSTKLLPKGSVVIAITGATLGQVSLLEIDSCANQSVVGVIPNDDFSSEFLYLWIKFNIDEIILNQTGGAQQHINKNDIANYHIIKPDKESLASVNLKTYFEKISHNTKQIQNLQAMRDMLLKAIFA